MNAPEFALECLAIASCGGELSAEAQRFIVSAIDEHVLRDVPIHVAMGLSAHGGIGTRRKLVEHLRDLRLRTAADLVPGTTNWAKAGAVLKALSALERSRGRIWLERGIPDGVNALDAALFDIIEWCRDNRLPIPRRRRLTDILQRESPSNCTQADRSFSQLAGVGRLLGDENADAA
jgi:hypothetical protein